ncbi:uncharacterized protein LOC132601681 [Lycium barbarum]|uniref:uncharacterized protein LOC132601681 n=1 Tax=Lycium barbarum TaxID=112863 RepID=UPI00293F3A20|nr:uncharacterized protein LOC132601681 [Lycium barbarum]
MKERKQKKQIVALTALTGDVLVEPKAIETEIINFYKSLMGRSATHTTAVNKLTMRNGPILSHDQQIALCTAVTDKEIFDGLCSIGNDKAPGVDGFNDLFFKKAWPAINQDVCVVVREFFDTGKLLKQLTALQKVSDNIILAHELVKAYSRKNISPRCLIKVDIQKAYDTLDWKYLEQVMEGLGFPYKFVRWVLECVSTVSYSLLINGELTTPFNAARGLRQGDPMSPFLFAIVMEYLSRNLKDLSKNKRFKFHRKCQRLDITHLSFADDLLLFARGNLTSVALLHEKFTVFTAAGLQANLPKSAIYYGGVDQQEKSLIQTALGYSQGAIPFKYLGIPLDTNKLIILQWQHLIDTIVAKIASWTAKKLSYAGRIQLVQTVLWSTSILGSNVCHPSKGGYNLINLKIWNKAAVFKMCWDLSNKQDKLWIKWIHSYYIKDQSMEELRVPQQASRMVRKIFSAKALLPLIQLSTGGKRSVIGLDETDAMVENVECDITVMGYNAPVDTPENKGQDSNGKNPQNGAAFRIAVLTMYRDSSIWRRKLAVLAGFSFVLIPFW